MSSLNDSYGGTFSGVYHISRRHAIEPIYFNYQQSSMSDFVKADVRDKTSAANRAALSVSLPKYIYAASYFFTPYYSKMHIGYNTVAHFDFFFGAGMAYVAQDQKFLNGVDKGSTNSIGASLTTGMRFLFRPRFAMRFELRDFIYKSEDFGEKDLVNNLNLALSFEVFLGSTPKND